MHRRALLATRPPPHSSAAARGAVRVTRRHLGTESAEAAAPKKKSKVVRRLVYTTVFAGTTFYVGSSFVAFNNKAYYNFFSNTIPLGSAMLDFAEYNNWDTLTVEQAIEAVKNSVTTTQAYITAQIKGTEGKDIKEVAADAYKASKQRAVSAVDSLKTTVHRVEEKTSAAASHQKDQIATELADLVKQAEEAAKKAIPPAAPPAQPATAPPADVKPITPPIEKKEEPRDVYDELPIGFEAPAGYKTAPKKAVPAPPPPPPLPRVAASVADVSDPIIKHLAATIDDLASYLKSNPTAVSQVGPVLETAKADFASLVSRIAAVKAEERKDLESKLDEQTRQYNLKLVELEMEAQDRLDDKEEKFRKVFDDAQVELTRTFRAKLDSELHTHMEIINERLKEEVVAQGIELQRRWIRDVKVRVEQERGGRLAKLDELSSQMKRLERIALDNSTYLDENLRIHAFWTAIRSLSTSALSSAVRKPYREELRILRHVATAREDPITSAALDILESNETADVGVEPFADLATWFSTSVAPKVTAVALVPDQNAGVLSHLASHLLSNFRFKRHGLVEGSDVNSVLARTEYYLNEKDLDSATRELNQLKGTAQVLASDWLAAARKRLEVEQALEVVHTQATLASVLLV